ncbi:hypothetical protein BKA65DRAFT_539993 [Rhexocercosporidium sp. MPI-PUGE-AT-0058]|nr:hypothetical protein BKA65DRAFT_539993 [Rhexocercosporidium sp. MPI-PUGE-AT-0058]
MAKVLQQPWISTMVEEELTTSLNSFRSYVPGQAEPLTKANRTCGPSGVEIRLKRPRQAQVTEFQGGLRNPYDAVLSDGFHHIHAIFDKDAAQSFTDSTYRDFHDIKGGIIVIKNYRLVVNSTLSPTRLTLRVLDFKFSGSEGSLVMGRPVDILTLEDIESLVANLECLFAVPPNSTETQLSSTASQVSQDKSSQPSTGFATQVNHRNERAISSPVTAQESRKNHDSLVAHLAGDAKDPKALIPKFPASVAQKSALSPVAGIKVAAMNSKLDARANVQRSRFSTQSSGSGHGGNGLKFAANDMANQGHPISSSDEIEKENSQERARTQKSPSNQPEPRYFVQQQQTAAFFVDDFQRDDAFEGLNRVPRRFAQVPKDQKAMLEGNDCWYEPQSGNRPRYANIPPKVMEDLVRFRDRKHTEPEFEAGQQDHGAFDSEEDSESNSANEQSVSGDDEQSMHSHSHEDQAVSKSLQTGNRKPKSQFPSSDPQIKGVVDNSGSDNDPDDDDCTSWDPTPEPDEIPRPRSEKNTPNQPRLDIQISSPSSWKPQRRPYTRMLVDIPPSSPTREEELELAVPYAIGDIVDVEDVQVKNPTKASQELPSTAPPNSTYIQVKRTPYAKSRSFDEASLRRTATGSERAKDVISSSPIIPATFNDTSSSSKQITSLTDQVSTGKNLLSSTEGIHTGHTVDHTQITMTQVQNLNETRSLQRKDDTAEEKVVEETVISRDVKREELRVSPAKSDKLSRYPSERESTTPSGHTFRSSKLPGNHAQRQRGMAGESSAMKDSNTSTSLPQAHLSRRERQMLFSDLNEPSSGGNQTAAWLKEEGKRKARDARRKFKAEMRLTRQASDIEMGPARLPSSPVFPRPILNAERSKTPEADPELVPTLLLSPSPDIPIGIDVSKESLELTQPVHNYVVDIGPLQDEITFEGLPPQKLVEPNRSSRYSSPSSRFHDQSLLPKAVDQEAIAFFTPPRKPYEQDTARESTEPGTPSSAQPLPDEADGHSSPREALEPESLASAQSLAPEDNIARSLQATTEVDDLSIAESRIAENDEQSLPHQATQPSNFPSVEAQTLVDEQIPSPTVIQAEDSMPIHQDTNETHEQPQPSQTSKTRDLPLTKSPSGMIPQGQFRIEEASDLKYLTFGNFLTTYPDYTGDRKCFTRALVCLEWLRRKQIPHWSICDDFIRAYVDFEPFVRNHPEKRMTAWEYYDSFVQKPVYQQSFIDDKDKLAAALSLLNPLYVKYVRDKFNAPAADTPPAKVFERKSSKVMVAQAEVKTTMDPLAAIRFEERGASPELGLSGNTPRRHARKPFFETPSQLHSVQRREELGDSTRPVTEVERSDKKRRALPWKQCSGNHDQNSPSPRSGRSHAFPDPKDTTVTSAESRKRQHSNDQRRATLPPPLRTSSFASPTFNRREKPHRPISRDSEVFDTLPATASVFEAARASPELPDFTEKWVAQLRADDPVEEPQTAETSSVKKGPLVKGPMPSQRQSGFSPNADSPRPAKKRPYRDLAEAAKAVAQRRKSGGLSSRASTPYSTPAKRFCTKPKGEPSTKTPAKYMEPETQAWEY